MSFRQGPASGDMSTGSYYTRRNRNSVNIEIQDDFALALYAVYTRRDAFLYLNSRMISLLRYTSVSETKQGHKAPVPLHIVNSSGTGLVRNPNTKGPSKHVAETLIQYRRRTPHLATTRLPPWRRGCRSRVQRQRGGEQHRRGLARPKPRGHAPETQRMGGNLFIGPRHAAHSRYSSLPQIGRRSLLEGKGGRHPSGTYPTHETTPRGHLIRGLKTALEAGEKEGRSDEEASPPTTEPPKE